jgi:hypothetical protein
MAHLYYDSLLFIRHKAKGPGLKKSGLYFMLEHLVPSCDNILINHYKIYFLQSNVLY